MSRLHLNSCGGQWVLELAEKGHSGRSSMSRPESRPDPIGGSKPSPGRKTRYWDSLLDFFF